MAKQGNPNKQIKPAPNMGKLNKRTFYSLLKSPSHNLDNKEIVAHFQQVNQGRVQKLASLLSAYLTKHLPAALDKREGLVDYRTNPYVLLTSARVMGLDDPQKFADFLFNTKLYMGLETSFGKSIEAAFVCQYPLNKNTTQKWDDPPEKLVESKALEGLTREEKAGRRIESVWREIDKSCVIGNRRFLTSIKSGPNCINDTQVAGMTEAIVRQHGKWIAHTRKSYPGISGLDLVIGITYGTDKTTNNKENQILAKLLMQGFVEEDREKKPGVLIDKATRSVRVYRRIGKDFWSMIGDPVDPSKTPFIFLEMGYLLCSTTRHFYHNADVWCQRPHAFF